MIATLTLDSTINTVDATLTDQQLIEACNTGNSEAYQHLYKRYHQRIFALALSLMHNFSLAEDLTQEIFVQCFRHLKSFRGEASFFSWLYRIALNHIRGYQRTRKYNSELPTETETLTTIAENQSEQTTPVIDQIALEEAILQLPPGAKQIFLLHDVEGYEHHEIGEMLGIDPGTSKSQLHKARLKLQKILKTRTLRLKAPSER